MKCIKCGNKVFRDLTDEDGKIGRFRICVSCNTIHVFGWDVHPTKKKEVKKNEN